MRFLRLHSFIAVWMALALCGGLLPPLTYSQQAAGAASRPASLWKDPGNVATYDFAAGPGGNELAPQPPFYFVKEDLGGSTPKLTARDKNKRIWSVKFGQEAPAEAFATRLAWAAGYWVQPTYYVAKGRIVNARMSPQPLERVRLLINEKDGAFTNARFELRTDQPKFLHDESWSWKKNPFLGTRQLNGLKILMMLTSNWDTKDADDTSDGPNTAVFEDAENGGERYYVFTDWGASMGRWGNLITREKWDCSGYAKQSRKFITGMQGDVVQWGFGGKNKEEITSGITVEDVRWLMNYLGRISDEQLRAGLRASGATEEVEECFTKAVRDRLAQLQYVAESGQAPQ